MKEKQFDDTKMEIGGCRFCGQTYQIEVVGPWTEEMLDEVATNKCNCQEAMDFRKKKEPWISAKEK